MTALPTTTGITPTILQAQNPSIASSLTNRKTILTGLAASALFGVHIGICIALFEAATVFWNYLQTDTTWFADSRMISDLSSQKQMLIGTFLYTLYEGGKIFFYGGQYVLQKLAMQITFYSVTNPFLCGLLLIKVCVIIPIAQEIFFRGWLDEKIRALQNRVTTEKTEVQEKADRLIRQVVQVVLFALCNSYLIPGLYVTEIFLSHLLFGAIALWEKERTGDLWAPATMHIITNTFISFRILFAGG